MMEGWHDKQRYIRARLSPGQYIIEEEEEKIILQQVIICMSFTMKMLAVSLLVIAMMALTSGAEAEAAPNTEPPPTEKEVEPESTLDKEAEGPESGADEEEDETNTASEDGKHQIDKRAIRCPCGWAIYRRRCFRYFRGAKTWALAQRHCQGMGGTLASVHNRYEENWLKRLAGNRPAWIGLSDAQQERYWFWSNGARITYWNFCRGQPDNGGRKQHCVQFNWSGRRCWDDDNCLQRKGYVCVRP